MSMKNSAKEPRKEPDESMRASGVCL